jgi:hypothetical protein
MANRDDWGAPGRLQSYLTVESRADIKPLNYLAYGRPPPTLAIT